MYHSKNTVKKVGQVTVGTAQVALPPLEGTEIILIPHPSNTGNIFLVHAGGPATGGLIPSSGISVAVVNLDSFRVIASAAAPTLTYWML